MTDPRVPARYLPSLAALSGVLAIAVGAAAVHGVTDPQAKAWLQTGVQFQLPHAVAVFALLGWRDTPAVRGGAWGLLAGSLIFAGTLDALALGAPRWFGAITPIGGTVMMLGWLWLALAPFVPGTNHRGQPGHPGESRDPEPQALTVERVALGPGFRRDDGEEAVRP